MSSDTEDLPREVTPIEFEYIRFDSGKPKRVSETRHLYYTMGAMNLLYDLFGVDKDVLQERLEGVEDPDEAQRIREEVLEETEVDMSMQEAMARVLYVGLRPEARAQGETLSVEKVEDMIEIEDVPYVMDKVREAFTQFRKGQETETPSEDADPADIVGKATGGQGMKAEKTQQSPR